MRNILTIRPLTFLYLVAILAVMLAWFVEYKGRYRNDILGVWYYPTAESAMGGYWETLTIRRDGTFSKLQKYRFSSETYQGKYSFSKDGRLIFHVTSKHIESLTAPPEKETFNVDAVFYCRFALDSQGNLVLAELNPFTASEDIRVSTPEDVRVTWQGCYTPISHHAQLAELIDKLTENVRTPQPDN